MWGVPEGSLSLKEESPGLTARVPTPATLRCPSSAIAVPERLRRSPALSAPDGRTGSAPIPQVQEKQLC